MGLKKKKTDVKQGSSRGKIVNDANWTFCPSRRDEGAIFLVPKVPLTKTAKRSKHCVKERIQFVLAAYMLEAVKEDGGISRCKKIIFEITEKRGGPILNL